MTNPLLEPYDLEFGAVPFDKIKTEHYLPALKQRISEVRQRISKISSSTETPSFSNTVVELELSMTQGPEPVILAFHNLLYSHGDEKLQELAKDIMPMLANLELEIYLDPKLFDRVKSIYDAAPQDLNEEQQTLLRKTYLRFVRNGALLDENKKSRIKEIDNELSVLGPSFSQNVLASTNAFELVIEDEARLKGLPESVIAQAKKVAEDKGHSGKWVLTLQMPCFLPVLTNCEDEQIRKDIYMAHGQRAQSSEKDNRPLVAKIVNLRNERARLMGYKSYADFVLEERMATSSENVWKFLEDLRDASLATAKDEIEELKKLKKEMTGSDEFHPWDIRFYGNKHREKLFDFDPEVLRPYFAVDNVTEGAFLHAERLFGLKFKENRSLPVYHEDVKVYEVNDMDSGEHKGLLYIDLYPRNTKRGGAWCSRFRSQSKDARPHATIVCNFSPPVDKKSALLSFNEVNTFFHEFGHGLHNLLSQCEFGSLSCTNVYRDFVELPSQFMENWLYETESLNLFAKHHETSEEIPANYIEQIIASRNHMAGIFMVRQLNFGFLDMAYYSQTDRTPDNIEQFERQATQSTQLLEEVPGNLISTNFEHIFSGGYSAGYYSYKWAEVLDADAFEYFKENGLFNRSIADSFKENILSKGGSVAPDELYRRFRTRDPDPKALLRRSSII